LKLSDSSDRLRVVTWQVLDQLDSRIRENADSVARHTCESDQIKRLKIADYIDSASLKDLLA